MSQNKQIEIEKIKENIQKYREMLEIMPMDTVLGRLSITACLKHEENKLKRLLKDA